MADLDDFFAKKDRKKAKAGKKFTTTDEIAKKLEETGKRPDKVKPKEKSSNPEHEESLQIEDEDEWKEFEEQKKDYTGLKIGNLTVTESPDIESEDERGTGENSSDGESTNDAKKGKPWQKTDAAPQPEKEEQAPPPPAAPAPAAPPAAPQSMGSSYKPPHLRNPQPVAAASPRLRTKNIAPDIHSEEYFPTLNSKQPGTETTGAWGTRRKKDEGTFEEVRNRGGSRSYTMQEPSQPKLSLGNKYGALSQDQS